MRLVVIMMLFLIGCSDPCREWIWEADFELWHSGRALHFDRTYAPDAHGVPSKTELKKVYDHIVNQRRSINGEPDSAFVNLGQMCSGVVPRYRYKLK